MADNDNNANAGNSDQGISRRTFIKNTGLVTGGIVGGGLLGSIIGNQWQVGGADTQENEDEADQHTNRFDEARIFFSRDEDFEILSAATERIFPEDDNGPGAVALGAPYFIDKQLAGQWGLNAKEYMRGPFQEGEAEQGYQSSMTRSEIFTQGIRKIDEVSTDQFDEKFFDLEEEQQVEVLNAFDTGDVDMRGVSSSTFFSLLRQATIEGVYSDPLYGGNKNMDGWRMKEYPGAQPAYINVIESEEFVEMEPTSLRDHH
ncbi:gluconate 2-dehydrogenase gamma chain [Geomicrobium halophilum]|uniref:Gluconate 2-dehydrogenase gamma chain n=1 Tax=Geomicrobium halophilum TaxID=549000 RepID=A0A841PQI0_9BACL|nr:gluconate 2-dehydrogenase subunit 3 family protein [Geomicrobium halophilum]MBB6448561.1 gluconate 2-dehydrogenase gamma chain [Geomicrobium halophilum]